MFKKFEFVSEEFADKVTLRPMESFNEKIQAVVFTIASVQTKNTAWGEKTFADGKARIFRKGKLEDEIEATLTGRFVQRLIGAKKGTMICVSPITGKGKKGDWFDWDNTDGDLEESVIDAMGDDAPPF